jgi:hypothetical protein
MATAAVFPRTMPKLPSGIKKRLIKEAMRLRDTQIPKEVAAEGKKLSAQFSEKIKRR